MLSKREVELELALWQERKNHIQTTANLLNAQGQTLQTQMREVSENIARLEALQKENPDGPEKPPEPAPAPVPEAPPS